MLWFVMTALAQEEVCSPRPLSLWQEEVRTAQKALDELRLDAAIDRLDHAHKVARCVSDVIPRDDVRLYAQLRTLQAFYEQDAMVLESWGLLAKSLGSGSWPVPDDHPIHRLLAEIELPPPSKVEGKVLAPPKRGGVFIDGTWADLPVAITGTYHLVQVFDADQVRQKAYWQDGAAFDPELLAEGPPPPPPKGFDPESSDGATGGTQLPDWRLARKDSLKKYLKYVEKNPGGEFAPYARRRIDDLTWAQTSKTADGAKAYLAAFPNGRNRGAAEGVLQGVEFKEVLDRGDTESLKLFLGRYPEGVYATAARRQLDERAWVDALMEGTEQAYARYRVRWPQGAHFEEARIAQDDLAWEAADGRGRKAMEAYLQSWPDGGHAREARAYLDGLSFETIRITVDGSAPEEARLQAAATARDELQALGFVLVEEEEVEAQAELRLQVDELGVGEGLGRWITTLEVWVASAEEPLARQELLQDPASVRDALMDLQDGLEPELRRLGKFRASR